MTPYDDALLELALREVLGAESPPDLWPALARRLPTSGHARLRLLPGRDRRSRTHLLPWAAAAVVLLALGVLWWTGRPAGEPTTVGERPPATPPPTPPVTPPVLPTPHEPLGRVQGDTMVAARDGRVREDDEVDAGERVVVGPRGALVRLRDGSTLRFDGEAWLALDASDEVLLVRLARGSVQVATTTHAVRVDGGPGPLTVEAGSSCRIARQESPDDEHPSAWLGGFATLHPADLVADVEKGRALANDVTAPAGRLLVWLRGLEPRTAARPSNELRAWIDERLAAIDAYASVDPGTQAALEADKLAQESAGELRTRLADEPEAWAYAVPWLERRVADRAERFAGRVALRVLVHDPDQRAAGAVHARLTDLGTDARPAELLPLAELADDPVAIDLLHRRLRDLTSVFDVYPAVYFAFRGDGAGRAVLEQVVSDANRLSNDPVSAFAAAAGLRSLGSPEPWDQLRVRLEDLVETALADGRPELARWPLTAASYFAPVVRGGRPVSVDDVSRKVSAHGETLPMDTADDIRSVLRSIP